MTNTEVEKKRKLYVIDIKHVELYSKAYGVKIRDMDARSKCGLHDYLDADTIICFNQSADYWVKEGWTLWDSENLIILERLGKLQ